MIPPNNMRRWQEILLWIEGWMNTFRMKTVLCIPGVFSTFLWIGRAEDEYKKWRESKLLRMGTFWVIIFRPFVLKTLLVGLKVNKLFTHNSFRKKTNLAAFFWTDSLLILLWLKNKSLVLISLLYYTNLHVAHPVNMGFLLLNTLSK